VAIASRACKAMQDYVTHRVVQRFGTQIFNDGLRQTLRLRYQEFEDQISGETLSLLLRVRRDTERFINAFINVLFASLVGLGFLLWYAVTRSWLLVPVFLVGLLVLGGLSGLLSRQIRSQQRALNRETTRIFALEMQKVKRIRLLSFLQGTTLSLLKLSILFALLWLIFRNVLTPGELIAMQFISVAIFAPLQEIGNIILAYREADASLANFATLMARPIERRPDSPVEVGPVTSVRFDRVTFRHRNAPDNALDEVSFAADLDDTIAFVGPSGSGKSTLVKLLVGLYTPGSGEVYYNDISTRDMRYNEVRRQIGFVTQETQLFAGTLRDNIRFVKPDASDAEIIAAMEQAACANLLARSPEGLDTLIGEMGIKLSGGEKQRLSIARALIRHPRLLIFDEATSALDSLTEEQITETVRGLSARRAQITILIAHRLSTVMHADTIFVLEKGRIVESGVHAALLAGNGLYAAMWRQQIGERPKVPMPAQPDAPELAEVREIE